MADDSWLKAHDSWLMFKGVWPGHGDEGHHFDLSTCRQGFGFGVVWGGKAVVANAWKWRSLVFLV